MQKNDKFFEDIAKVSNSMVGFFSTVKKEIEANTKHFVEQTMQRFNFVTRDEIQAQEEMLAKARLEQEEIKSRLSTIEKELSIKVQKKASPDKKTKVKAKAKTTTKTVKKPTAAKKTSAKTTVKKNKK